MPIGARCQLPPESRLRDSLPRIDYLDSFEVPSRIREQDLVASYAAAVGYLPRAFKRLLVLRSRLVKPLGIAGVSYADLARPIDYRAKLCGGRQDRALDLVREVPG